MRDSASHAERTFCARTHKSFQKFDRFERTRITNSNTTIHICLKNRTHKPSTVVSAPDCPTRQQLRVRTLAPIIRGFCWCLAQPTHNAVRTWFIRARRQTWKDWRPAKLSPTIRNNGAQITVPLHRMPKYSTHNSRYWRSSKPSKTEKTCWECAIEA